ncbi:hypothetical protein C8F00_1475 [Xanthomonas vasicola]
MQLLLLPRTKRATRRVSVTSKSGNAYLANIPSTPSTARSRRTAPQTRNAPRPLLTDSQVPIQRATSANALRAAASVASITASSCALDMKPASYAEGARYTPRCSIAWKKRLKVVVSHAVACA